MCWDPLGELSVGTQTGYAALIHARFPCPETGMWMVVGHGMDTPCPTLEAVRVV